jgi:hypothetical protein
MFDLPKMEPMNQDCMSLTAWLSVRAMFQGGTTHKYDGNGATDLGTYLLSRYR